MVPALAEANAARIERMKRMGVYRQNVVPMARVRIVEPETPPVEALPDETRPEDDVIELPNFLPVRKSDVDASFRLNLGRRILRAVSSATGVSIIDLKSERRTAKVVLPRHIACWVMRELTTMSLPQIGRHLGGRDHTSILFAINKIERLRETSPDVRRLSDEIATSVCAEMRR